MGRFTLSEDKPLRNETIGRGDEECFTEGWDQTLRPNKLPSFATTIAGTLISSCKVKH